MECDKQGHGNHDGMGGIRAGFGEPVLERALDESQDVASALLEGARSLGIDLEARTTRLYDVIDPDALDQLFRRAETARFVFTLWEYTVVVTPSRVRFFDGPTGA